MNSRQRQLIPLSWVPLHKMTYPELIQKIHPRIHIVFSSTPIPILRQINPVLASNPYYFTIHINIIPICVYVFQVASFLQVSLQKPREHVSSLPFVTHVPSVSTSFISSR